MAARRLLPGNGPPGHLVCGTDSAGLGRLRAPPPRPRPRLRPTASGSARIMGIPLPTAEGGWQPPLASWLPLWAIWNTPPHPHSTGSTFPLERRINTHIVWNTYTYALPNKRASEIANIWMHCCVLTQKVCTGLQRYYRVPRLKLYVLSCFVLFWHHLYNLWVTELLSKIRNNHKQIAGI